MKLLALVFVAALSACAARYDNTHWLVKCPGVEDQVLTWSGGEYRNSKGQLVLIANTCVRTQLNE